MQKELQIIDELETMINLGIFSEKYAKCGTCFEFFTPGELGCRDIRIGKTRVTCPVCSGRKGIMERFAAVPALYEEIYESAGWPALGPTMWEKSVTGNFQLTSPKNEPHETGFVWFSKVHEICGDVNEIEQNARNILRARPQYAAGKTSSGKRWCNTCYKFTPPILSGPLKGRCGNLIRDRSLIREKHYIYIQNYSFKNGVRIYECGSTYNTV